jgi:hypothetical protein
MGIRVTLRQKLKCPIVGTPGSDVVQASRESYAKPKFQVHRDGSIRLLGGNDRIRSRYNIRASGPIHMGSGHDVITGRKSLEVRGFDRQRGSLRLGRGKDTIQFRGGHLNFAECSIDTGDGDDLITAQSARFSGPDIITGKGNDRLLIDNELDATYFCNLAMGEGDDHLQVSGGLRMDATAIDMGAGNDTVDVLGGGVRMFSADDDPRLDLGDGDDRFIGFASPTPEQEDAFYGMLIGNAGTDTVVLPSGTYTLTPTQITTPVASLRVSGFEWLEGINGGRFPYASGLLTVDANGVASFTSALA